MPRSLPASPGAPRPRPAARRRDIGSACYPCSMRARLAGIVVGVVLVAGAARTAAACGYWKMIDREKHLAIGWLINAAEIKTDKGRRLAALYLDLESKDGVRVVASKKVIFDVKDGVLRRYGKPIGRVDAGGAIAIGKQTYTIAFTDRRDRDDLPAWTLTVTRGDDVIVTS